MAAMASVDPAASVIVPWLMEVAVRRAPASSFVVPLPEIAPMV